MIYTTDTLTQPVAVTNRNYRIYTCADLTFKSVPRFEQLPILFSEGVLATLHDNLQDRYEEVYLLLYQLIYFLDGEPLQNEDLVYVQLCNEDDRLYLSMAKLEDSDISLRLDIVVRELKNEFCFLYFCKKRIENDKEYYLLFLTSEY